MSFIKLYNEETCKEVLKSLVTSYNKEYEDNKNKLLEIFSDSPVLEELKNKKFFEFENSIVRYQSDIKNTNGKIDFKDIHDELRFYPAKSEFIREYFGMKRIFINDDKITIR